MSYPCSKCISSIKKGKHRYITYELEYPNKKQEFLEYIIPVLQEEYGINIQEKIKNVKSDRVKNINKFLAKHLSPDPNKPAPGKPHLKVTRGKLPEILARELLRVSEGVKFTCRTSLEEEDPDMPKRGADNFGFVFQEDNGCIRLDYIVCCEVKASDSKKSPPDVVHVTKDSLFTSLKDIANLSSRLEKAIAKSIDRLEQGEYLELVCDIAESLERQENLDEIKHKIVVVPFMLRKKEFWTQDDYGKFNTSYKEFDTAIIKYYIVTVDYPLIDFADEIYNELRES